VLSYNSWRGLAAHRPLGPINRLKLTAYDASSTVVIRAAAHHWLPCRRSAQCGDIIGYRHFAEA